jgi:catechol 2,3-dioxygenase-like lactoylglutathione lyase family enzyme
VIRSVHHAQITIPTGSENEARRFYCELLGLTEAEKPVALIGRGGLWLQVNDFQVHIGVEDGIDRGRSKSHLAYLVDDLEGWRQRLLESGLQILNGIPIPEYSRFEFRDPFGNRVEFLQADE